MTLDLAIILPTLNERDNLAPLVDRIEDALGPNGWEVLVVDDNSADGTADEARRLARGDTRVRVLQRIGRRGLSSAAIEGFCATAAPYVAVMDADHQHDPKLLKTMLEAVRSGEAEVAVASRFAEGASMEEWGRPDREKLSSVANGLARRLTGVELSDPMSGYFLLSSDTARALVPRLSGIGFKILLDLLATSERPLKVKDFPMNFAARRAGESKLDRAIALDFLAGLYDKSFGRIIPTRFALFGTVGALGVLVHLAILYLCLLAFGAGFTWAQGIATFGAMTFNFWLNNFLTYRDRRLKTLGKVLAGWASFVAACSVGAFANVAVASALFSRGLHEVLAAMVGIGIGSVWNYALSSRFVWGRY
ncbi:MULTISPECIES: glycosyltransferase [Qipengyuania]|uniref:Glycosyltransferase family 2 protein n=2 Tax=Qipengyuania TaxID=1855416 RepID=A0A9Q3XD01_9SPHN|nr:MULTISPECIES: glycosyltransferase family 2 protein [Qipengyuania]MBY6217360.1 glycosyltransferase family 2 protein [Qipengyuania aquimaris]QZD92397.1 glycosyltransferase family 2 protein [Qipengyuania xiapuensis]